MKEKAVLSKIARVTFASALTFGLVPMSEPPFDAHQRGLDAAPVSQPIYVGKSTVLYKPCPWHLKILGKC